MPATPADLWRSAAGGDPARPFVTSYDEATGGRVELSFATFDNWVAKTANLLTDGLGAAPGDRVALALPVHWQSLAWLVACWSAGVTPILARGAEIPGGDIVVADAARLGAALDSGADEVVGASLHPLGAPLADCPPPAVDYAVEVRGHGDRFTPAGPADPAAVALEEADGTRHSGAELVARAAQDAARWELGPADRVAVITSEAEPLAALGPALSRLTAPLHAGAALVLSPGIDSATLQSRLDMERVTAIAGARSGPPSPADTIRHLT